jgi:DNA invertase Pin-like site-specific DNA recombinase
MQYNEIRGIAKSISRYCWKKDAYHYQEFIDRQSRKGRLGGVKGGLIRSAKYEELRIKANEMFKKNISKSQIAINLNVSRRTVIRWLDDK